MKDTIILNAEQVKELKADLRETYLKANGTEPTEKWLQHSIKAILRCIAK